MRNEKKFTKVKKRMAMQRAIYKVKDFYYDSENSSIYWAITFCAIVSTLLLDQNSSLILGIIEGLLYTQMISVVSWYMQYRENIEFEDRQ